jgi:hypothetical protein
MFDVDTLLKSIAAEMGTGCRYYNWKPSPAQEAFIFDESPVKLLTAPNRTGKSASLGRIVAELAWGKRGIRGKKLKHYNVICSSLTYQMSYAVMVPAILQFIPDSWWELDKMLNEIMITNPAGITVKIFLRCQSQGREKAQGISGDLLIQDEQLSDEEYGNELKMRVVDVMGEQIYAFTPLLGANFLTDTDGAHHHFKISDNPILSRAEMEAAAEKMSDVERRIRLDGEIIDLSGNRFISGTDLAAVRGRALPLVSQKNNGLWKEYYFTDEIYDEGVHYIITEDVASGSGEDYTHIVIYALYYDGTSQHVFSSYSNLADVPTATDYVKNLNKIWNNTSFLCDATGLGISVAQTLAREAGITSMRRKDADLRFLVDKVGFQITEKSREWLLYEYRYALAKNKHSIGNDPQLFSELKVFAYDLAKRRYEHPSGHHDDAIFAHALANVAISMSRLPDAPKKGKGKNYNQLTFDEVMAIEKQQQRQQEMEE